MDEVTDRDIELMHDAELEYHEEEARKSPAEKLLALLQIQQRNIEKAMELAQRCEDLYRGEIFNKNKSTGL